MNTLAQKAEEKKSLASRARRLWHPRGQAMVEYSSITFFLAMAGGVGIITLLPELMNALNSYLQGIYFMLNAAIP
jgi:hypothetical protein